jgi:hypothetical protein
MKTKFSNVVSVLALTVALGTGGAWAAGQIKSDEIGNGQVRSIDIRDREVKSKDLARKGVKSTHVRDDSLTGVDINENALSTNLQRYDVIPSGVTVTGAFQSFEQDIGETVTADAVISFPAPAPAPLDDELVQFAPDNATGTASEFDETCTGSADNPTAPAGKVCMYVTNGSGDFSATGVALPGGASRYGFRIEGPQDSSSAFVRGTWAYTAP